MADTTPGPAVHSAGPAAQPITAPPVTSVQAPPGIDPRGPRVGAAVTSVLLVVTLLLGTGTAATILLGLIAALFAVGVVRGVQGTLGAAVFRAIRPRLAPPTELEDPRPPRFAQLVGLIVTGTGVVIALAGLPGAVPVAAAIALVAAFLNAVFGLCLGCELYLVGLRLRGRQAVSAR